MKNDFGIMLFAGAWRGLSAGKIKKLKANVALARKSLDVDFARRAKFHKLP